MKKLLALILSLILILCSLDCFASVTSTSLINIYGYPIEMVAYNIDGNNYFKLRDVAEEEYTAHKTAVVYPKRMYLEELK